jgi:hypothetical protein
LVSYGHFRASAKLVNWPLPPALSPSKTQTFGTVDIAMAGVVATERPLTLAAEVTPCSLIAPWRLTEKATHAVKRRVPIDNDNEDLAQMTLRARQRTHAMPRVRLSSEQQAAVAECFRSRNALEFLNVRGRPMLEAPTIVKNKRFSTPSGIPILLGVEIKNMGTKLTFGVAMR